MSKAEHQLMQDPFLLLGYGINAYFNIMISLAYMCLCITIFMAPVIFIYMNNEWGQLKDNALTKVTLGNYGGASNQCFTPQIKAGTFSLYCPAGAMIIGRATEIGIISNKASKRNYCTEQAIWKTEDNVKVTNCS